MSLRFWSRTSLTLIALAVPALALPALADVPQSQPQTQEAQPATAQPTTMPPAPPARPPAPPVDSAATATAAPAPAPTAPVATSSGQWVYTNQYGWIWMPYDQRYTYVDDSAGAARMYVYYPSFGWRWVAAPWVLGIGPAPFWDRVGPVRFAWYAHPWFRPRAAYRWNGAHWGVHAARWHEGPHGRHYR